MRLTALVAAVLVCTLTLYASSPSVYSDSIKKPKIVEVSSTTKSKTVTNKVQTIEVSSGDSLSQLATTYNTTVARLFDANTGIVNPDLIYPGEALVIPGPNEKLTARPFPTESQPTSTPAVTTSSAPEAQEADSTSDSSISQISTTNASDSVWYQLADCESGGDWSIDTGNGFYGGLQFTLSSWQAVGGVGYPNQASPAQQIAAAQQLENAQGWGAWPVCSAELGL